MILFEFLDLFNTWLVTFKKAKNAFGWNYYPSEFHVCIVWSLNVGMCVFIGFYIPMKTVWSIKSYSNKNNTLDWSIKTKFISFFALRRNKRIIDRTFLLFTIKPRVECNENGLTKNIVHFAFSNIYYGLKCIFYLTEQRNKKKQAKKLKGNSPYHFFIRVTKSVKQWDQ